LTEVTGVVDGVTAAPADPAQTVASDAASTATIATKRGPSDTVTSPILRRPSWPIVVSAAESYADLPFRL
jgi:hypothetical protein